MFHLSVLNRIHGDFTHSWDPQDAAQVANARAMFDNLKKMGYMIYETKKSSDGDTVTHEVVHNFDALHTSYFYQEPGTDINLPDQVVAVEKKQEVRQLTARPATVGG